MKMLIITTLDEKNNSQNYNFLESKMNIKRIILMT